MRDLEAMVDDLSLEEQVSLLSGQDSWSVAGNARLGFGPLRVSDGPNGARGGGSLIHNVPSAAFPAGIALGATWNTHLVAEIGAALADEARSKKARVLLAPTVNIHRSVTNGRNFECYSEDPVLTAKLAAAYIGGLQHEGIAATIKHFAGNESEIERTTASSEIDERTLREVYLLPFEAAVKTAGTWAIMSSYNRLNGTYAAENHWLLTKVLRQDWGYDGIVMSDWFGSRTTAQTINAGLDLEMPGPTRDRGQKLIDAVSRGEVAPETVRTSALRMLRLFERTGALDTIEEGTERADDRPEHRALIRRAGAEAMVLLKNNGVLPLEVAGLGTVAVIGPNARVAQIMGGGSARLNPHYAISPYDGLAAALRANRIVYAAGCANHRFEPTLKGTFRAEFFANTEFAGEPVHVEDHTDGIGFFLDRRKIAGGKVDPEAFSARYSGSYTPERSGLYRLGAYAAAYLRVFLDGELIVDLGAGKWRKGRTFYEEGCDEVVGEIELEAGRAYSLSWELVPKKTDNLHFVAFAVGIDRALGDAEIAEAVEAAAQSAVALVFVGRSGEWDTEGSDLASIALPGRQNELVAAVASANHRTIVVLQTGGPVEMPWLDEVAGVIEAWYPGQEAGNAIADVVLGRAEPGGRLPQSFPARWADNPTHSQDPEIYPGLDGKVRYEEGVFVGYRHYDRSGIAPLFPFGFGLSYTGFKFAGFEVENLMAVDGVVRVHVGIRNTGARTGSSVVQLYVRDVAASVPRPEKELKAFAKLVLDADDARTVTLELSPRDFAFFDVAAQCWRIEAGKFEILAGFSSADLHASAGIDIAAATLPLGGPL